MNCGEFQSRWQAWLAAGADEETARVLEAHVAHCPHCEQLIEAAGDDSGQDEQLLRDALAEPRAAARIAERAIARLAFPEASRQDASAPPAQSSTWSAWIIPLLSLAAGFLLAVLLLKSNNPAQPGAPPTIAKDPEVLPAAAPVAQLVAATGPVHWYDKQRQDWVAVENIKSFACPTDSRLRTAPYVRCELQTSDGCVIRLNDQTEVTLRSSSSIELRQGQVWCRSPRAASLEVRVTSIDPSQAKESQAAQPTMWCVGASCLVTGSEKEGRVQVVNAAGEINLQTATGEQRLEPGQVAEISNGEVTWPARHVDPVLSTRWMQPLLVQRDVNDREVRERVDVMLAQIGRSKIATLYEQEIRSLGEHAVLPLVRFIQSPLAAQDPPRRHAAMQLIADLAPVWLIPDLIDLLEHDDAYVRRMSAQTLFRLTAMDMNLSPDTWQKMPDEQQAAALQDWRNWWALHRDRYPAPRVRISHE